MILVTGATGLVGSHLLLALTKQHQQVRALYRTEKRKEEVAAFFAFAKASDRWHTIDWVQADLLDIPQLSSAFDQVTQVYHCAALISFDPYRYKELRKVNVEGTANVVNLCLSQQVQKIVYLSSIATLAKTPNWPITEENHWDPNVTNSVYAITKYGGEMEVWRGTQEGLDAIILNPGIILGAGRYDSGSGVFFTRVAKGLNHYTSGGSGVVDVLDVVDMMLKAMDKAVINERYIIIAQNWTYQKLLATIAAAFHKKPPKRCVGKNTLHVLRLLDSVVGWLSRKRKLTKNSVQSATEISEFNNQKAQRELGYQPRDLEDSIARIVAHFKTVQT